MSEFEGHTPGPWGVLHGFPDHIVPASHVARANGGAADDTRDRDDYAQIIAKTRRDRHGRGDHRANAALIAAAPRLASENTDLLRQRDEARAEVERLRAALTEIFQAMPRTREPWTHEAAADEYCRLNAMIREIARAALTHTEGDQP